MKGLRPYYEKHHGVRIEDEALEAAVRMSVRYINDRFLPDKAIDIIDEAASKVQLGSYRSAPEIEALEIKIRELLNQKEEAIKLADLSMAKRIPVSYTHLDVYKRQGYDGTEDCGSG